MNGTQMEWREGMTVADVLRLRNYVFRLLVVQVNGELVKRGTYDRVAIADGANVDVIHMISGG